MTRSMMSGIAAGFLVLGLTTPVVAEIPATLTLQGRLTDPKQQAVEGAVTIAFRLYDAATGGTKLWEETQTLTAAQGLFSALLGQNTPLNLPFDKPYWVEIQVGSETLTPRQPLVASPYALRAKSVEGLTAVDGRIGLGTAVFPGGSKLAVNGTISGPTYTSTYLNLVGGNAVLSSNDDIELVTALSNGIRIKQNGHVGIGTPGPGGLLHVSKSQDNAATEVKISNPSNTGSMASLTLGVSTNDDFMAALTMMRTNNTFFISNLGDPNSRIAFETRDAAGKTAERLRIDENGRVGIGTTSPGVKLDVAGDIRTRFQSNDFIGNSAGNGLLFDGTGNYGMAVNSSQGLGLTFESDGGTTANFFIGTGNQDPDSATKLVTVLQGGNVGIGTVTPKAKLDVEGALRLAPSGAPANPAAGTIYFEASRKHFYGFDGATWKQLDN